MKRALLLIAICLSLPLAALADSSTDFTNSGGLLLGSNAGLDLTGSTINSFSGWNNGGTFHGDFGTISLTTGALLSGSLKNGGTFAAGGTFTISGDGAAGLPNGTIFSGTFSSPVTWTMTTLANGSHQYTLTGTLSGTLYASSGNESVTGVTTSLTFNTGWGYFYGLGLGSNGTTTINSVAVPEPSTLGFLGMGLIGVTGLVRRRTKLA